MKKTFRLENLDCANCAAKMEESLKKIEGISDVNISFMSQKLSFEASESEFDRLLKEAEKAMKKIEADVEIIK